MTSPQSHSALAGKIKPKRKEVANNFIMQQMTPALGDLSLSRNQQPKIEINEKTK